ncbi:MAG: hypothetical protein ACREBF_03440 [Candidatus Micrarchaeales archaeon]
MTESVPAFAQSAYAVLSNKFGLGSFSSDYLGWFISKDMVKKTLHILEGAGWIKRIERGEYSCIGADEIFKGMLVFRVPDLLKASGMKYVYADASAAEIWTDYTYIQRSWEHSPYYIDVLKSELDDWVGYLRGRKVKTFVKDAGQTFGEFVVLRPRGRLISETHNGLEVEPLGEIARYCEEHIDSFEYHLAYLHEKFGVRTRAKIDRRVMNEARSMI